LVIIREEIQGKNKKNPTLIWKTLDCIENVSLATSVFLLIPCPGKSLSLMFH
jgi:hypothetical protein